MWSLECTKGFPKIWSSNLVFNLSWPIWHLSEISLRETFWLNFMSIGLKMWLVECTQGFSKIWPSELVFNLTWPILKVIREANILTNVMSIGQNMWPLEHTQGFPNVWPSDLVSDPTWPFVSFPSMISKVFVLMAVKSHYCVVNV